MNLTSDAVNAAMDECDRLGVDKFLDNYGYSNRRIDFWVVRRGIEYPSKAIVNVAFQYLPGGKAIRKGNAGEIGGGDSGPNTACTILKDLGFEIVKKKAGETKHRAVQARQTTVAYLRTTTNLILYGPPGTGKTYETTAIAVSICNGDPPSDRAEIMAEYKRLTESGQIEFVTFHQSYSYEEFVEGLRPHQDSDVGDGEESTAGFHLQPEYGIFKRIATRATKAAGRDRDSIKVGDRRVFKMSIGEAANPEDNYLFEEALETEYAMLGWGSKVDWSDERFGSRDEMIEAWRPHNPEDRPLSAHSGFIKFPFTFRNRVREGDIIVVSKGNSLFRAIGVVTGPYEYAPQDNDRMANRRKVKWLWVDRRGTPVEEIYARSFSMASIYELDRGELKIGALERYIASGTDGGDATPEQFVLIIDEINRANISKVFGELITLIEPDKRIGCENELLVTLPYSREKFGVPANLHIIGTMNTADRSIALLDTALRRRFEFRELMPQPDLLPEDVDGVPLRRVLTELNKRIEYLFDREHQIGHALFMTCASRADVDHVMRTKVIPLLQEYFFEDWRRIAEVLGDAKAEPGEGAFIIGERLTPPPRSDADAYVEERWRWTVRDLFAVDAYERF